MDIIILSIIISLLFIVFAFGPILFQEFSVAKKGNPDINFTQFIQKYFANEKSLDKMDPLDRKLNCTSFLWIQICKIPFGKNI